MGIRRGTVREDGRVFWAYRVRKGKRYEAWVTKESFAKFEATRKKYSQSGVKKYKEEQEKLPPEQRNYLGKYNPENGLYFIRIYMNGTPRYGTLEDVQNFKIKRKQQQKSNYYKSKAEIPPPSVCLGDPHPTDPNLVVVTIRGHNVKYGPIEKLQKRRERIRQAGIIYRKSKGNELVKKYKEIRHQKLKKIKENPELKFRRGDVNPITNWKFWGYSALGNEVWLHPDEFVTRRTEFNRKRLEAYYKKRGLLKKEE